MKVAPISGDLLLELGVVGAVLVGGALLVKKLTGAIPANAFNPTSPDNLAASGVNALGNAIASTDPLTAGRNADGSWTLGGAIYDAVHGGQVQGSGRVLPPAPAPSVNPSNALEVNGVNYGLF